MTTVLVTGATGLIGANVCKLLVASGIEARALVRAESDGSALQALGVELVTGDITSRNDVFDAAEGADAIVNSAAQLGGIAQDMDEQMAVNYEGSLYCYDAAKDGGRRMVELTTTPFLRYDVTLTEHPEILPDEEMSADPYAVSKGKAYAAGQERCRQGEDILFVIPGGTFGPSPVVGRAFSPTSFNTLVRAAIRGRVSEFGAFPVPWVRAEDVADCVVKSLAKGKPGVTYIAFGPPENTLTTASFLNMACEVAGVEHRIQDAFVSGSDEVARDRYGATMFELMTRPVPSPQFDNTETRLALGYAAMGLRDVMIETVEWFRENGRI
jgi:dihydroflavonol-4-reductase